MGTCTHVVFAGGPIPGVDTRSRLSARLAALDVARVVAADSGLELADALGVDLVPGRDRVVGDMDSLAGPRLGAALESGIDVERFPVDKDATDLALALDDAAAAVGLDQAHVDKAIGAISKMLAGAVAVIRAPVHGVAHANPARPTPLETLDAAHGQAPRQMPTTQAAMMIARRSMACSAP